jgi:hypothetical protein
VTVGVHDSDNMITGQMTLATPSAAGSEQRLLDLASSGEDLSLRLDVRTPRSVGVAA